MLSAGIISAQEGFKKALTIDEESGVSLRAENYTIDLKKGEYNANGDVELKRGDLVLRADKAVYNPNTNTAEITGDIFIEAGGDTLSGESGTFNLVEKTGVIHGAHLFLRENNFYVSGGTVKQLGEDFYMVNDFRLTTCDSHSPEWSITGSEITVTEKGSGKVKHAAFRVKNIPLFYIPYMTFPVGAKRQSGILTPLVDYSDRNGAEMEIPLFWAISDSADATLYERFMVHRGVMHGVEFRYAGKKNSKGAFNLDILSDDIEEKNMNDPDQLELSPSERTNSTRYWFRGRADHSFQSGIEARVDADFVSDQDYLKEFESGLTGYNSRPDYKELYGRPFDDFNSPFRESTLRLSYDRENYSIQASSAYYLKPENPVNDTTPQPVAGMYFSMLPGFIKETGLTFSMDSDYDYIWRDSGQKGHSLSVSPGVSYPVWFGNYLRFKPELNYTRNMQWLDSDSGINIDSQSRDAYHMKASLSTVLERIFDLQTGKTGKLKHKIVPGLVYEYRSHKDLDRYRPWFEPVDDRENINRIALSFDNFLDGKKVDDKGNAAYSQWGKLSIIQGYDISESRRDENPGQKKEPFEPLTAVFSFTPFRQVDMDTEVQWDHYRKDVSYADVSFRADIERSGGRKDIYRINYVYNESGNKGLGYYVDVNLTEKFSVGSDLQRDIDLGHDIEKRLWIGYKSQCWSMKLGLDRNDDESRIMLSFDISGFGD